jgi:hypothetical protein
MKYVTHEQMVELKSLIAQSDRLREQARNPRLSLADKLELQSKAKALYRQAQEIGE